MLRLIIFILFLGSGMTGLIYQVVWTKLLTLTFGVTVLAVSTVLTCFFGGLALGSFFGGRWVDRHRNGFLWYGTAELIIGVYALLFSLLLGLNNSSYVFIAQKATLAFFGQSLLKFALSVALLIIPTTLMGATLPILSKALARSQKRFARDVGGLYSINTVGAVVGAVITAFLLIPSFGLSTILYSAGFLNIAIGATAIFLGSVYGTEEAGGGGGGAEELFPAEAAYENNPTPPGPSNQTNPPGLLGPPGPERGAGDVPDYFTGILILGFALSGFTGLAYEVIWTRVLGFMLTGTVYAFAAVLAVFLTGIALGSFVFSQFTDRIKSQGLVVSILAAVEILIGLSSIALITLYDRLPGMGFYTRIESTPVWSEFIYLNFFAAFITLIIPTFLFGATFPLVCKIYDWRAVSVGTKIGNIYSVNTVGGILGSFVAGFVMVPFIGMQNTIVLVGLVNVGLGVVFMVMNPFTGNRARYGLSFFGVGAALVGILTLPPNMPLSLHKSFLIQGEDIVFYTEGATATVMIAERKGYDLTASNKRLWVNGNRATAAFYEGLQINRFQGVLPMVLHPDPREVLVICFGSGTTFGTLSQFPVERVDNIEIASSVIKGAPYFKKENMDVLNNPISRITIDDGRSYLAVTDKKYDVITEEPMHPSLAGVVNLYTKEYYELARAHLKDGGIMSQWIPLYNLSIEDVKIMVKTFQSVFPHTSIWLANTDIFLIGSPEQLSVDYERVLTKLAMPNVKRLLADIDLEDPDEFLNTFVMNEEMVKAYAGEQLVMTDDMPVVEFTGPRSLNLNTISPNLAELLKFREPVTGYLDVGPMHDSSEIGERLLKKFEATRYNLVGRAYFAASNFPEAAKYFRAALAIDPADRNSLHYNKKLAIY